MFSLPWVLPLRLVTGGTTMIPGPFVALAEAAGGFAGAFVVSVGSGSGRDETVGVIGTAGGAWLPAGVDAGAVGAVGVTFIEVGITTSLGPTSLRAGSVVVVGRGPNMPCRMPPLPIGGRLGAFGVKSIDEEETPGPLLVVIVGKVL